MPTLDHPLGVMRGPEGEMHWVEIQVQRCGSRKTRDESLVSVQKCKSERSSCAKVQK